MFWDMNNRSLLKIGIFVMKWAYDDDFCTFFSSWIIAKCFVLWIQLKQNLCKHLFTVYASSLLKWGYFHLRKRRYFNDYCAILAIFRTYVVHRLYLKQSMLRIEDRPVYSQADDELQNNEKHTLYWKIRPKFINVYKMHCGILLVCAIHN